MLKSDTGPLAQVPLWVLESPIHHGAIRLFGMLSARWTDREGAATPSRAELAQSLNCSLPTVDRWIKQLVDIGALDVTHQKIKPSQYLENLYQLSLIKGGSHISEATLVTSVLPDQHDKPKETQGLFGSATARNSLDIYTITSSSGDVVRTDGPRFESFWLRYPRHERKQAARDVWKKLKVEQDTALYTVISDGLVAYLKLWSYENREKRYIPNACRWLKERQFEDIPTIDESPKLTKASRSLIDSTTRFLERRGVR